MSCRYQIELASRIRQGRVVGNEYVVTRGPERRNCILARFDTREEAAAWIEQQSDRDGPDRWRVESRYPAWARWRIVPPRPHDERRRFDDKGLVFDSEAEAEEAAVSMRKANRGEYRVVVED